MAGSIAVTTSDLRGSTKYSVLWTSDASGVVSANTFAVRDGLLKLVKFIPGAGGVQPTDQYDMTITDADGIDVLAATGANLSNATATATCPNVGTYHKRFIEAGNLTPVLANAGNAKQGTVVLVIEH